MRDDVRLVETRVLGLDVKDLLFELDVVVEAHLGAPKARALHLGFELRELFGRVVSDLRFELAVLARYALHPFERHLRDPCRGIDAQRFGEQTLTFGVVRAGCGPGCEQSDRFVGSALLD